MSETTSESSSDEPFVPETDAMTGEVEEALRSDLESGWPEARILDRRANVGFSDGKTTSHAFRIRAEEETYELVVGPRAAHGGDADGVVRALRERDWIPLLQRKRRILVEKDDDGFSVGPRPDSIVF